MNATFTTEVITQTSTKASLELKKENRMLIPALSYWHPQTHPKLSTYHTRKRIGTNLELKKENRMVIPALSYIIWHPQTKV